MSCYQCHFKINADELMYINREPTIINLPFIIAFNYYIHTRDAGITVRNSHQRCSVKKAALTNSTIFHIYIYRKTPVLESLFEKIARLMACNFIKKRLQHRCFPVNMAKIFNSTYFKEYLQLLLDCFLLYMLGYQKLLKKYTKQLKW